jgi:phage recombination protein Bet
MPGEPQEDEPRTAAVVVTPDPTKKTLAALDWDAAYTELVKRTVLKPKKREATNTELYLFAEQVERTGLNPFLKQIYGIYRYDSQVGDEVMGVQVGIDGFRLVAERTHKYEGQTEQEWCGKDGVWKTVWAEDDHPYAARCGVWKTGRRTPTYAVAHYSEYVQNSPLWKKMGRNQLSKCAEALALRKAFPNELSGLYTPDEMAQADNTQALDAGQGDGQPQGFPLGDAIEAVLARAATLGVALDRGMVEMDVCDRDGTVIADRAAMWIATHTAVLDAIPQDAEVVDDLGQRFANAHAQEAPVSAAAPPTPERTPEPPAASEAPPEHGEPVDPAEALAVLRRRATELLNAAQAAEEAGNAEEADSHYAELAAVEANLDAMTNDDQGTLI